MKKKRITEKQRFAQLRIACATALAAKRIGDPNAAKICYFRFCRGKYQKPIVVACDSSDRELCSFLVSELESPLG